MSTRRTVISSLPSRAPHGLGARYRALLRDAWGRDSACAREHRVGRQAPPVAEATGIRTPSTVRQGHTRASGLVAMLLAVAWLPFAASSSVADASAPYIVVYRQGVSANAKAGANGVTPSFVYRQAVSGFAANLTGGQLARIRSDPDVVIVQPDAVVFVPPFEWNDTSAGSKLDPKKGQVIPTGIRRIGGLLSATAAIDGIDSRVDADVAILDGGIDTAHPDLNVAGAVSCIGPYSATGHGTHVAGTVGALDNDFGVVGVAAGARIWSVQVLDSRGNGTLASVICGVDWVADHADVIDVANMSLSALGSDDGACGATNADPLHMAICNSVDAGVTYVVAAGNAAIDASRVVPAAYDEVITVSALADWDGLPGGLAQPSCNRAHGYDDALAVFSDFGADIDIAAPGTCILSTWRSGRYEVGSGTSMSSPHVAGAAALYLATHPAASTAEVRGALIGLAEPGPIAGDPDAFAEGILDVASL